MSFDQLKKELHIFYPVFLLEKIVSHNTRRIILRVLVVLLVLSFALASGVVGEVTSGMTAVFFLFLIIYIKFLTADGMYFSYRFGNENVNQAYALSEIVYSSNERDLTLGFIESHSGGEALLRAGIDDESIRMFLSQRKNTLSSKQLSLDEKAPSHAKAFVSALLKADTEFETFLNHHNVTETILWGSFVWATELTETALNSERFWSKENLDLFRPIGRDWAYGEVNLLKKYSTPLTFNVAAQIELHEEEIKTLEISLSKSSQANALIIGEEGSGKLEIIEGLARKIDHHTSSEALKKKHFLVLNSDSLLAHSTDAASLEKILIAILEEMAKAGNLILVIPNLFALLVAGGRLGVDIVSLLTPYMRSPQIHIVGVTDPESFHAKVSGEGDLMQHMVQILVKSSGTEIVTKILMQEVKQLEEAQGVFFTFPAIQTSLESANHYFVGTPLYDSASDLLLEGIGAAHLHKRITIIREDILEVVKRKTGVETGEISDGERNVLIHLEDLLHERVIGQAPAIKLVSDAFRRSRSGINDPSRPLGSFLFLGPTGVGKTETAKALTEIFFGDKGKMNRLDMSEYNTADALSRLIGGYDSDTPGVLSSMVRDNPYGVLLLDEFEKTNPKVLDLFLQIIDEGVFSDAQGKKISARNLIIVATSNASSQIIFNAVSKGNDLLGSKDEIVNTIIAEGIFKPELINRFDGVILFEPLGNEHLRKIATLMLGKLSWRLKEKGMTLVINDALINYLVKKGNDPKFGARPLNRAIQDTVEKIIADGIISLRFRPGSTIELSEADFHS